MTDLCSDCKKNIPGNPKDITFSYAGQTVTVFKNGSKCFECVKNEWIKELEELKGKFIGVLHGRVRVNWGFYIEAESNGRSDALADILISIGVLSSKSEGNWNITDSDSVGLNPKFNILYLYFTHREDAMDFVRAKYSSNLYGWKIHYRDKTIKKYHTFKRTHKKARKTKR